MRALFLLLLVGCGHTAEERQTSEATFDVDAPALGEAWICSTIAVPTNRTISRIEWTAPKVPGLLLHHATLYAVRDPSAVDCDTMPEDAASLDVHAPGATALAMPEGLALEIPEGTTALVVQAHGQRTTAGEIGRGTVRITEGAASDHHARWLPMTAPVPAIRPRHEETSTARCYVDRDATIHFAWPHMHRIGKSVSATLVHGAERTPIALVSQWDFDTQRVYPLDLAIAAGDAIELSCTWSNPSADYVLPGGRSVDEMCTLGLVASPSAVSFSRCE